MPLRCVLLRGITPSQARFTNLAENTENKIVDSLLSAKSICFVLVCLTSQGCIPKLMRNDQLQIKAGPPEDKQKKAEQIWKSRTTNKKAHFKTTELGKSYLCEQSLLSVVQSHRNSIQGVTFRAFQAVVGEASFGLPQAGLSSSQISPLRFVWHQKLTQSIFNFSLLVLWPLRKCYQYSESSFFGYFLPKCQV